MMEEVDLADTPLAMRPHLQSQGSINENDEPPDPRIQVELERLNTSTDLINKLEVDLDEARMKFRQTLSKSTQQIDSLTKKLGKCIEQARPYYDARMKSRQALTEAQKSAIRYERAVSQHAAAREMVQLAEEGLLARGCVFDFTWQEMLNHAITKVNDAEREKVESTAEHKEKSSKYHESETRVMHLQKELKRAIAKSRPYFELKAGVNQHLEEQKRHVRELEAAVVSAKTNYAQALTNLETISDQIHKTRQTPIDLSARGIGVGAESPGPPLCPRNESVAKETSSSMNPTLQKAQKEKGLSTTTTPKPQSDLRISPVPAPITANLATSPPLHPPTTSATNESTKSLPLEAASSSCANSSTGANPPSIDFILPFPQPLHATTAEVNAGEGSCPMPPKTGDEVAAEGMVVADGVEAQSSYLAGWQFVALPGLPSNPSQNLLSIEDRESIVSDSESLTSMEMLSEEAIANLMLEDEINEATHSICSPHFNEEFLAPPETKGTEPPSQIPLPLDEREEDRLLSKEERKNSSQTSSSDSGEPWEVVGDPRELSIVPDGPGTCKGSANPPVFQGGSADGPKASRVAAGAGVVPATSESPRDLPAVKVGPSANPLTPPVSSSREPILTGSPVAAPMGAGIPSPSETSDRPKSLGVNTFYPKPSPSVSSSSTSNSISEDFSPSYARLGDTPDFESTSGSSQPEVAPGPPGTSVQPPD